MSRAEVKPLELLIAGASEGDSKAMAALINLSEAKLFKFCFLLGQTREMAEDLCQEVYIRAFQNISKLKEPKAFQSWLYQIAKNVSVDMGRAQKERPMSTAVKENQAADIDLEALLDLQKYLSEFEVDERFLLLLVELEGFSYSEAAELIGTTEAAVRSKLHRIRKELANRIEKAKRKTV